MKLFFLIHKIILMAMEFLIHKIILMAMEFLRKFNWKSRWFRCIWLQNLCPKLLISVNYHILFTRKYPRILESVQDFLIKLDMKPCMHLVEISIFSLNHVIVRLTKIMNNLLEHLKIHTFKVIFLCEKLVEYFQIKNSMKNI